MPTIAHKNQVWRDLYWLLNSPSLVNHLAPYPVARFSNAQLAALHHWLEQEAREPRLLTDHFSAPFRRLGLYAESLLTLALQQLPQSELLLQHFALQEALEHGKGKRTIGELDYVWRDKFSGLLHHWELTVKLYLYIPPDFPASHPIRLLPPQSARRKANERRSVIEIATVPNTGLSNTEPNEAPPSSLQCLDRFVGTQRIDTLYRKLNHLQKHQLPLGQHPQVQAALQQRIDQSAYDIKGWLFYPLRSPSPEDWSRYYLPEPNVSDLLNPQHLRGWWLLEDAFEQHLTHQESGNKRWKILPRLEWLSPHSCLFKDSLSSAELREALQQEWLFLTQHEQIPQPQLVVALEESPGQAEEWREVHRGFVIPQAWC